MGSRLEKTSNAVRKRIEQHTFDDEDGDEYEGSKFGGFPEYFRRKKIKLQNRDASRRIASDKPAIFKGIVVHVNGYTQPSLNDIHNLVIDYGGGFLQYLDGKTMVTHIVASNLTPKKKVEFRRYRIVKPAWIVDSIAAGKLLPWESYRVVDEGVRQNLLGFKEGQVVSQANDARSGYREQTDTSWYTGQMKGAAEGLEKRSQASPVSSQFRMPPNFSQEPPHGLIQQDDVDDASSIGSEKNTEHMASFDYGSFDDNLIGDIENDFTADPELLEDNAQNQSMQEPESAETIEQQHVETDSIVQEITTKSFGQHEQESVQGDDHDKPSETSIPGLPSNLVLKDDLQKFGGRKLTAEEHNAILLSDPRMWKSSTVNPGFLKQYYEESRLHHLSAWKAELKSKIQAHTRQLTASQQAKRQRPPGSRRYIFHVDFDSFFVAVSLLKHPELADKPVVVAHGDGSGSEIASCNYPARAFGVKNGMWMKHATEICPNLKVLPYDFKAYEDASREFYAAIIETGGMVQSVSVDEALIDLSVACTDIVGTDGKGKAEASIQREEAKAQEIARDLRLTIKTKTGCDVSVGIGGSILLAKIALRKAKPAGQHLITPDAVLESIGDLNVQDLPGVAYSMGSKLEEIGIKYVKDIRDVSKEKLTTTLGPKTGEKLWEYARGIDRTEIGDQSIRKSVSAEVNWGVRFVTQEQADEFVRCLCEELEKRLKNEDVKGRQLTMKIMRRAADSPLDPPKHLGHGKCDVFNKSVVIRTATTDSTILSKEALSIMKGYGFSPGELRGIGLQMTKLEPMKPSSQPPIIGQRSLQFKTAPKFDTVRQSDPDEVDTPKKPERFVKHPAATLAASDDTSKVLNTLGTQFVLPTQVDPAVLAELPDDIQSKLMGKGLTGSKADNRQPRLAFDGRKETTSRPTLEHFIPSASQLDADVLAELPEDLRAEILQFHQQPVHKAVQQASLPQSPHKNKLSKVNVKITPTKPKTTSLARVRGRLKDSKNTFMQANFAKINDLKSANRDSDAEGNTSNDEEISAEFLAALPEDIRQEVLDQQRRERLKRKGGLEMGLGNKKKAKIQTAPLQQRVLELPAPAAKPAFTSQKFTTLPELREALSEWFEAFKHEEPDLQDVQTLCTYLTRVVREEKDIAKVVGIVKWLLWMIEAADDEEATRVWRNATDMAKDAVQGAVRDRGLGPVSFD